jgi:quercetin dioxygenase-like cupin family protein
MGKTIATLVVGVVLGIAGSWFFATTPQTEPEQQAESDPEAIGTLPGLPEPYYKVLFENDVVRIVEHRLETGDSEPEHTHPPMVAYFVEGATAVITEADGSTSESTVPTGAFLEVPNWWTHSMENTGETPLHSILVEFKDGAAGG